MIHKSLFFTGNPIVFTKGSGLGEIAQPTIGELMDNQMDINDFIEPFYLVMSIKDKVKSSMLNTLYALSERDIKEGNEPVLLKFQRALMLLYHVSEEFIKLDLYGSSQVIIKILDEKHYDIDEKTSKKKYKSKGFAAGCSREVIERGANQLGWELEKLLTMTLQAMAASEDTIRSEMEEIV